MDSLVPVIPRMYLKGKNHGDTLVITDTNGKQHYFKLVEDRKANMAKVAEWKLLGPKLIEHGFIGTHAQMDRFLANRAYFSSNREKIFKLQKQDPALLTDEDKETLHYWDRNIDLVVNGKKSHNDLLRS